MASQKTKETYFEYLKTVCRLNGSKNENISACNNRNHKKMICV